MRILLCTPAFGGMVTVPYLASLIQSLPQAHQEGFQIELHMQYGESLIPRARNACAMFALKGGFDKLMFIDADIQWTWPDLQRLLKSKAKIVGGLYPLKAYPITLNFNPLDGQRDLFGEHRQQDNYIEWCAKYADPNTGEAEVAHIPTGFMLIDCSVLAALSHKAPPYTLFAPDKKTRDNYYDFFPIGVIGQEYRSEDWAFCDIAREMGFKVILQTRSVTRHFGVQSFGLGQHEIIGGDVNIAQLTQAKKESNLKVQPPGGSNGSGPEISA